MVITKAFRQTLTTRTTVLLSAILNRAHTALQNSLIVFNVVIAENLRLPKWE